MTAVLSESSAQPTVHTRRGVRLGDFITAILAFIATDLVAFDVQVPILRVVAGLFVLIVLPTYLVYLKVHWSRCTPYEAIIYSFVAVLLGIIVGGLLMNELLPLVGIARPLDRLAVLVATDLALLGLLCWRHWQWPETGTVR
jgi:uncharacterized membrane protein